MTTSQAAGPMIVIQGEEEPISIGFEAVAAYHGQAALAMLAVTFQALRAGLALLSPDAPPRRNDLSIVSGHPGPGVRDAFEFVTRAVTRGAYVVDRSLPEARFAPGGFDMSYSFRITLGGKTVELAVGPETIPARFFALNFTRDRSAAQNAELSLLKRTIAADVLARPAETLFAIRSLS